MIHFLAPAEDADFPPDYIRRGGIEDRASVLTFEEVVERDELPFGAWVFAGINRLGPAVAELLADVHRQLHEATGIAPLNHPLESLRRYELIRALHARDLIPYTAYGAWEDFSGVRLPAFVRPREEDTVGMELRHSLRDLETDVGTQLAWGRRPEELIVVEFADTAVEGVYTKYSVYRIGDRYIAKSIDRGPEWVLRRPSSRITMELVKEADEFEATNPHGERVREIFELARIEFGRIDYSMLDGEVVCWEINTLPTLRRPHGVPDLPEEIARARAPGRARSAERFAEAFALLLERVERARAERGGGEAVRITHDPAKLAAARHELRTRGVTARRGPERFALLKRVARPLKPVLRPFVVSTIYPLLARLARR